MRDINAVLAANPHLQKYLYVRAFLLTDRKDLDLDGFPFLSNWNSRKLGEKYTAYTHMWQSVAAVERDGKIFFLFGHGYNPFTMQHREEELLNRIADSYGTADYWDRIDEITGLFVYGVIGDNGVEYLVDPSGMQSACCGFVDGHFYISSHPQLVGDLCGLEMNALTRELVAYKWYYRVMGPYLPADMTQFDELKRIVPNAAYWFDGVAVTHRRFYPLREQKECAGEEEYREVIAQAADILKRNMELVTRKWEKPAISLTGGIDSNTTFAAANGLYDRIEAFSYFSAEKENPDAEAAEKIAARFRVPWKRYDIPSDSSEQKDYDAICAIIDHNNGYIARGNANEYRKRVHLMENLNAQVEVKSWTSETIRAYWYKHFGRKRMPKLSAKLFRNLYKMFIFNRPLAHRIDKVFEEYIKAFEYEKIPSRYPAADMHYNEVTWGSWGGLNISEMKIYADLTIIYNNRKFLDLLFRVPLEKRISDEHHLDMKRYLNPELYDMGIRVVNMKETKFRAFMLNIIFTVNMLLPF